MRFRCEIAFVCLCAVNAYHLLIHAISESVSVCKMVKNIELYPNTIIIIRVLKNLLLSLKESH